MRRESLADGLTDRFLGGQSHRKRRRRTESRANVATGVRRRWRAGGDAGGRAGGAVVAHSCKCSKSWAHRAWMFHSSTFIIRIKRADLGTGL